MLVVVPITLAATAVPHSGGNFLQLGLTQFLSHPFRQASQSNRPHSKACPRLSPPMPLLLTLLLSQCKRNVILVIVIIPLPLRSSDYCTVIIAPRRRRRRSASVLNHGNVGPNAQIHRRHGGRTGPTGLNLSPQRLQGSLMHGRLGGGVVHQPERQGCPGQDDYIVRVPAHERKGRARCGLGHCSVVTAECQRNTR